MSFPKRIHLKVVDLPHNQLFKDHHCTNTYTGSPAAETSRTFVDCFSGSYDLSPNGVKTLGHEGFFVSIFKHVFMSYRCHRIYHYIE